MEVEEKVFLHTALLRHLLCLVPAAIITCLIISRTIRINMYLVLVVAGVVMVEAAG